MGWIEAQLQGLQDRFRTMYRWLLDLQQQLRAVQQGLIAAQQQGSVPPSGSSGGAFACVPSANVPVASGAPGSGSPGALTGQTIYREGGGSYAALSGTATIYNPSPNNQALSGTVTLLQSDGGGGYLILTQVC